MTTQKKTVRNLTFKEACTAAEEVSDRAVAAWERYNREEYA